MESKDAIDHLCNAIKTDAGYRQTWKANIAMAFQDEYRREYLHKGVWEIANKAADNFLDLLIQTRDEE